MIYWSNIVFPTIGFFAAYYFFYFTEIFRNNSITLVTMEAGYTGVLCHTNTIVWLLINIPFVFNAFIIYRSEPFKCKIYDNLPLFILLILNVIAAIAFFFLTSGLSKTFGLLSIPAY
jgi:hypothetical protein